MTKASRLSCYLLGGLFSVLLGAQHPVGLLMLPWLLLVHGELLLLDVLELGAQVELARLLLQLGELVLVLGHLLQRRLDEFSSKIIDGDVELVDLIALELDLLLDVVLGVLHPDDPLVVLLADATQLVCVHAVEVLWLPAPLVDDLPPLRRLPLLLLLQLLGRLLPQQEPEFLLPLRCHEPLLALSA